MEYNDWNEQKNEQVSQQVDQQGSQKENQEKRETKNQNQNEKKAFKMEKSSGTEEIKKDENTSENKNEIEEMETELKTDETRWWIIRVRGGKEDIVKSELENLMKNDPRIAEVFIPEEEEKIKRKTKGGEEKEYVRRKKIIPGYIYVKMKLDSELWNKIRSIPNVGYILGERGIPMPISGEKVESLKSKAVSGEITKIFSISIGDRVRIKSGPFKGLSGTIESVSEDRSKVRVLISIFGRQTPLEIEMEQIEKET